MFSIKWLGVCYFYICLFFLVVEVDHEARLEAATAMATEDDNPAMAKSEAIDYEQKVYRSGAKPRADAMATEDDRVNAADKAPEVEPPKVNAAVEPQREEPERQGRVYKNIVSRYVCLDYLHIYTVAAA